VPPESAAGAAWDPRIALPAPVLRADVATEPVPDEQTVPPPARVVLPLAAGSRLLGILGLLSVAFSVVMVGVLHLVPPSRNLDPLSRTISEYALVSDGWVFDVGVLVLAGGSVATLGGLVLRGLVRPRSWSAAFMTVWAIGLVGLVLFPKQGFGPDNSFAGRVHWTWTLIAFFSLPVGLLLGCRRSAAGAGRLPWWAVRLAWVAGGWFVVLALQTLFSAISTHAWNLVGFVERALSATEMAAVCVLALWVLRAPPDDAVGSRPDIDPV
jgi:hypothetical protein